MNQQVLMVVTADDEFVEYASRAECHSGPGRLHRALAAAIFNDAGQVLLQKRKSGLWDNYWDVTAATHPLHSADGDESYHAAMARCLLVEWGISVDTEPALAFVYQAPYGDSSENEYCVLMVGRYRGVVRPNSEHAYDLRWVDFDACRIDISRDPDKYTPWARISIEALEGHPLTRSVAAAA